MKFVLALLALVCLAYTAPQSRKLFHEHYDDFMDLIISESGHDLEHLLEHYLEFEEFQSGLDYIASKDFSELIDEFEHLPEFVAVVEFLEGHNIDITFFIDQINGMIAEIGSKKARHELSGKDITAFIQDCIDEFPKDKLVALRQSKYEEDESFRNAMDDFDSDEWADIFAALWQNETYQVEVQTLLDHGIDIHVILRELKAIMGKF